MVVGAVVGVVVGVVVRVVLEDAGRVSSAAEAGSSDPQPVRPSASSATAGTAGSRRRRFMGGPFVVGCAGGGAQDL